MGRVAKQVLEAPFCTSRRSTGDPHLNVIELAENLENLSSEELADLKVLLQAANPPARMLIEEEILARDDQSNGEEAGIAG